MDRKLNSLTSEFRLYAVELLARLVERQVAVLIVQTLRTPEEHRVNLSTRTSSAVLSKHLPRKLRGFVVHMDASNWKRATQSEDLERADAIDLAPFEHYQLHGSDKLQWNVKDPVWLVIGEEAERLGLRWGGRWRKPVDPGHVELVLGDTDILLAERARPWPPPALV